MTKKLLLTAAATGVLAIAGAASAHDLTFRAGPVAGIDASEVGATGFRLAEEAKASTTSGVFALEAALVSGDFPSGNNFIQIDLNGGTFDVALTGAVVTVPGCTVVLSSGGDEGGTTANFLVSSAGGAACDRASIDLPVAPSGSGDIWVRTTLRTETGSPIDPDTDQVQPAGNPFGTLARNQEALQLVDRVNAFRAFTNDTIGDADGADADTLALLADPTYTTLGGDGILGSAWIAVDLTAHYDLDPADDVILGHVTDATVTVEGAFDAFDGDGAADVPALDGNPADDVSSDEAVFEDATYLATSAAAIDYDLFVVEEDGDVIVASDYNVIIDYELQNTLYDQEGPFDNGLEFERIQREGTNVILPWMNDAATAATTGTNNIVRVSNFSDIDAQVSGEVLTSNQSGYTSSIESLGTAPAGGELVIRAADLAPLGDFGRGDVQLIIEADSEEVTVRRYAFLANGSTTELSNGTVASDQTPADPNDVP